MVVISDEIKGRDLRNEKEHISIRRVEGKGVVKLLLEASL